MDILAQEFKAAMTSSMIPPRRIYKFDIFKGKADSTGKVYKIRSVGTAKLVEGQTTYAVHLKTLLGVPYYLLPEIKLTSERDYAVLTREPNFEPGRKYFWHAVGDGKILSGLNAGLMQLTWDLFGANDIYLDLHPISPAPPELGC